MIRLGNRQLRWICALLAVAVTVTVASVNFVQTTRGKQNMADMTGKMKTVCVGRFLVDLPAEATVRLRRGFVNGYDVASTDRDTDTEFVGRIAQFETELLESNDDRGKLEFVKTIKSDAAHGIVFVHNRRPARTFEGDRLVTIEDVDVQGLLRLQHVSISAQAKGFALNSGDELVRLLNRFRATRSGEIPSEPGFCIGHAIVLDPYEHPENESIVMFAGLPNHPDVNITLSSLAGVDPAPRLLERHAITVGRRPFFLPLVFSHLREDARTINGLDGDELVMKVRETNFTTGYSYQWEMPGRQDDVNAPLLMLELDSGTNPVSGGRPVQSTLSEDAMNALWDQISGSVRLRSTAVLSHPSA